MKAVVLAGGKGTRLMPQTQELPKGLVPLGGLPILEIIVRQLTRAGIHEIVLSIGHLAEMIEAHFSHARFATTGIRPMFYIEDHPLGTAGSLGLIPDLDSTFLVMNGDILTSLDYVRMIEFHRQHMALLTVGVHEHEFTLDLGVASLNPDGTLVDYTEKPEIARWVSMGIYVCEPAVLRYIDPGEALDMPQLVNRVLADGHLVMGYRSADYWLDIGHSSDYAEASEQFNGRRAFFLPEDIV